jgi:ankyrin repeat protein
VELLLQNGAQPDLEGDPGLTPLVLAVRKGSVALVQLLLARGAKTDCKYDQVSEFNYI